jgi:predicted RNase H-like HicB family nuclease
MTLSRTIKVVVRRGERQYVAECVEIAVVTEGETLDAMVTNLREAVALHLDGEDPADFGLASNPSLLITMELEPVSA